MKPLYRILALFSLGLLLCGCSGNPENIPKNVRARAEEVQTLARLKNIGTAYRIAVMGGRAPRSFDDLFEKNERKPKMFLSARDEQELEVVWGVSRLEDGSSILAWEKTPDAVGGRCVLMANADTAQYLNKEEFDKTPKAKAK
jgi:hypothetical protein